MGRPRNRRRIEVTRARPLKPPATTAAHASYRVSGASEEGCPARMAEIRPLFPPGTAATTLQDGGRQQPPPPQPPEAGAGRRARGRLRSAQSQDELARGRPAQSRLLRPAGALSWKSGAMVRPLSPSRPRVLAGRGLANTTPGAQPSSVFFQVRSGPGEPCMFIGGMDYWKIRRKVSCTSACTVLFGSQQTVK